MSSRLLLLRVLLGCIASRCAALHRIVALSTARSSPLRVALVLRGESFRGGTSRRHFVATRNHTNVQLANYRSIFEKLITPFEEDGYTVDVFTSTYTTDFDDLISETFGERLKVFDRKPFGGEQTANAFANLKAFLTYANETGREYRFLFFSRHDLRFLTDIKKLILSHPAPDENVFLYAKIEFNKTDPNVTAPKVCADPERRIQYVKPSDNHFWTLDHFQVIPWKFIPAFTHLIDQPGGPFWPYLCWAELGPLVGGEDHLAIIPTPTMAMCKVTEDHGQLRIGTYQARAPVKEDCEISSR